MAEESAKKIGELTKCSICFEQCRDSRMLPCIHTFCLECLSKIEVIANKKPGEKLPCPVCRKVFSIPQEGMKGLQKNFFVENLIEVQKFIELSNSTNVCDLCKRLNKDPTKQIPEAKLTCLECQENYCDNCSETHKIQKATRSHRLGKIGDNIEKELMKAVATQNCTLHTKKPLEYYCSRCRKVVCVSCFVESHSTHGCKELTTVEEEFRQTLQKNTPKLKDFTQEMFEKKERIKKRKRDFMENISKTENTILKANKDLKDIIEKETETLMKKLSTIKENHLKELQYEMEEIEAGFTMAQNMETYCYQLISKGSAADICGCLDEILKRIDEIGRESETLCERPYKTVTVSFTNITPLKQFLGEIKEKIELLKRIDEMGRENETLCERPYKIGTVSLMDKASPKQFLGEIKERKENVKEYINCAFIAGISNNGSTITKEVLKIDLHRPEKISLLSEIPTAAMQIEASAAVYRNTMFVTGIGNHQNEIWKYESASGWKQCASLIKGRRRHSVAFVDKVLYICGGFVDTDKSVLSSVEAYNAKIDVCSTAGKLVYGVQRTGNCVPINGSLYIFGGSGINYEPVSYVQIYNTKQSTCSVLTTPMPNPYFCLRAALWNKSVILLGYNNCFIFNFETETWEKRKQFKTDVSQFGLALENGRIFVFGGGISAADAEGKRTWKCRDDIRYIPITNIIENKPTEWKLYARLPKPGLVLAYGQMTFRKI